MSRAALAIVLSGLVAACGQQAPPAGDASGPALDYIEATPIDEASVIEGPAFPRPAVAPVPATPAPRAPKSPDKEEAAAVATPAGGSDDKGASAAPPAPARTTATVQTPPEVAVQAADRALKAREDADAAARAARDAAAPAQSPPPQTPD